MGSSKGGAPKGGPKKVEEPRRVEPRRVEPRRVEPRRVEPRRVGGPKFRAFFSLLRHNFLSSFSLLGSFRGILVVFEAAGALKCARLEFSGCRVRAPAARSGGAVGVSHDSPRAQMCTFQGSGLQKHQQNSTKGPQERERRMKIVAGGGKKKSEILGGPAEGCPAEGCPAEGCPAEGCPAEGWSSGRVHRKWGAGFGVSGSVQVCGDENRNRTKTK